MSTHPLDSAFKNKLQDGTAKVPAGMWKSIETQIPASSGSRSPWIWVLPLLLAAVALGAWVLMADDGQIMAPAKQGESIENNVENSAAVLPATNSLTTAKEEVTSSENVDQRVETVGQETISVTPASGTEIAPPSAEVTVIPSADLPEVNTAVQDIDRLNSSVVAVEEAGSIENVEMLETAGSEEAEIALSSQSRSLINIAGIGSIDNSGLDQETEIGLTMTDCYSFDKIARGTWVIDAYVGPSYSIKSLTSKSAENADDYIRGRDTTESAQISFHAGLRLGYEHHSGLTAKAGVHYTLVNELYEHTTRTSGIVIDSIFDGSGNLIGLDTTYTDGTRVTQNQNKYHTVDIPLLIGYRIDNGDWDFGIEAGPMFNVAFSANGAMADAAGMPFSFSDESHPTLPYQPVFKDQIGISIYAGLYASKRVADKLWVFVEPHFQMRLKDITLDGYPIDQRQSNIGLSLGVRLKL